MATKSETMRSGISRRTTATATEAGKFKPVKLWAVLGAAYLAIIMYSMTAWIGSGKATPTSKGLDPVPTYMKVFIYGWQIMSLPLLAVFLYFVLIRPWRREGRMTTNGLLCFVFVTLWWQDPMTNWISPYFTYNAELINFGNWTSNIPGWFMPSSNLVPEPVLWVLPIYVYLVLGMTMVGCAMMRKAKVRWPQLGTFGLVMACVAGFVAFDAVLEPPMMIMGFWSYPGSIDWLTLFHGRYYQFPIHEAVLWGGVAWSSFTCVLYFKNDKGQTVCERGIDEVRATPKQKTWLRFLAMVGVFQSIMLFGYTVPMQFFNANASPWPKDIQNRSYFQNGLCGEGVGYECWGPGVPYPRGFSPRLKLEGELVDGTKATQEGLN